MSKGTYKSLQHRIDLKQEYPKCGQGVKRFKAGGN